MNTLAKMLEAVRGGAEVTFARIGDEIAILVYRGDDRSMTIVPADMDFEAGLSRALEA